MIRRQTSRPSRIRNPGRHCWRDSQRLVDADEVHRLCYGVLWSGAGTRRLGLSFLIRKMPLRDSAL
jgi:hypothetical protein